LELDLKTSMKLEDLKVKWVGFATFIPLWNIDLEDLATNKKLNLEIRPWCLNSVRNWSEMVYSINYKCKAEKSLRNVFSLISGMKNYDSSWNIRQKYFEINMESSISVVFFLCICIGYLCICICMYIYRHICMYVCNNYPC
jgi:hypothetical protein